MKLIDFSNYLVRQYYYCMADKNKEIRDKFDTNLDMLRHFLFLFLLDVQKCPRKYGEIVICLDKSPYWRGGIFEYYKKNKKKSSIDEEYFDIRDALIDELKEYYPVHVIGVKGAEGDDIIAILTKQEGEKHLIIGKDKDFDQLIGENVHLYKRNFDDGTREYISSVNEKDDLIDHIIKGDSADGIPNVLSDGDTFLIEGKKQTTASAKRKKEIKEYIENDMNPEFFPPSLATTKTRHEIISEKRLKRNIKRNMHLIGFDNIPEKIIKKTLKKKKKSEINRKGFTEYLKSNNLKKFLNDAMEF